MPMRIPWGRRHRRWRAARICTRRISWWVADADTILLVDEAYIHFGESKELESALPYVRPGKNVVTARTFSRSMGWLPDLCVPGRT